MAAEDWRQASLDLWPPPEDCHSCTASEYCQSLLLHSQPAASLWKGVGPCFRISYLKNALLFTLHTVSSLSCFGTQFSEAVSAAVSMASQAQAKPKPKPPEVRHR